MVTCPYKVVAILTGVLYIPSLNSLRIPTCLGYTHYTIVYCTPACSLAVKLHLNGRCNTPQPKPRSQTRLAPDQRGETI